MDVTSYYNSPLVVRAKKARNVSYRHPKQLNADVELQRAHIRAAALAESVRIDNANDGGDPMFTIEAEPVVSWRRKYVKSMMPRTSASAKPLEGHFRKWLVDTGCPIDLIASDFFSLRRRLST